MGLSRRSAESALVGAASQPIGGAFGPGKIVWSQRVTKCFARHPGHCRSVAPLISLLNPNGIGLSEMAVRQKPKRLANPVRGSSLALCTSQAATAIRARPGFGLPKVTVADTPHICLAGRLEKREHSHQIGSHLGYPG
jgi:hypothetical protein